MEKGNCIFSKSCGKISAFANKIFGGLVSVVEKADSSGNAKQRVVTSLVMIPVALYAILVSPNFFLMLAIIAAVFMTAEWLDIIKNSADEPKWRLLGVVYIVVPIYCVIRLRMIDANIVLWMFAIIWSTDIFAFFAGRMIGGAKLAPQISPNKTWAGLFGGVIASAVIGFLSSFMFAGGVFFFIFVSVLLSLVEQVSDLMESKFKRIFGIKDSGSLIPGHGGILDRLDGLTLTAPAVLILVTIFAQKFAA